MPETEPDLIQSQIRFFFLYRKKSWNYGRKQGQFQLLFLRGSVLVSIAAAYDDQGAEIGIPIVQSQAIVQIIYPPNMIHIFRVDYSTAIRI